MTEVDKGIDSIAAAMWLLIRKSTDRDWAWCVQNDPATAADLRYRAKRAIDDVGFVSPPAKVDGTAPSLDLRFKDAFVGAK